MCSHCDGNEYRETIEADARRRRREAEQIELLDWPDWPERAARDAYFQALLEDSFYRQKFNLAPRRIA